MTARPMPRLEWVWDDVCWRLWVAGEPTGIVSSGAVLSEDWWVPDAPHYGPPNDPEKLMRRMAEGLGEVWP